MLQSVAFIILLFYICLIGIASIFFCPCRIGKEGVTPHPDAGSIRGKARHSFAGTPAGILWIPHQVRNDRTVAARNDKTAGARKRAASVGSPACHPAPRCGVQRRGGEAFICEYPLAGYSAFIGPGGGQPTEENGRGLFECSEFRSPRGRRQPPSEEAR